MNANDNNECPECAGTGRTCGVHETNDACDCEDVDRDNVQCETCGGTGVVEDEDEEE